MAIASTRHQRLRGLWYLGPAHLAAPVTRAHLHALAIPPGQVNAHEPGRNCTALPSLAAGRKDGRGLWTTCGRVEWRPWSLSARPGAPFAR
jgi:hypothetical protein